MGCRQALVWVLAHLGTNLILCVLGYMLGCNVHCCSVCMFLLSLFKCSFIMFFFLRCKYFMGKSTKYSLRHLVSLLKLGTYLLFVFIRGSWRSSCCRLTPSWKLSEMPRLSKTTTPPDLYDYLVFISSPSFIFVFTIYLLFFSKLFSFFTRENSSGLTLM